MTDETEPSLWRLSLTYARALFREWVALLTGGLIAAVAALVGGLVRPIEHWEFSVAFVWVGLLAAGFKAWVELRKSTNTARLRLEADITTLKNELGSVHRQLDAKPVPPKLYLHFDPSDPLCIDVSGGDETLRLQVINDGDIRATGVSVTLEDAEPRDSRLFKHRHQPFRVMKSDDTVFSVAPSHGRAAVYIDVLSQRQHATRGFDPILRIKGAEWLGDMRQVKMTLLVRADVKTEPFVFNLARKAKGPLRPVD